MGAELSGLQPEPAATPSILALSSAAPSAAAVESTEVESSRPSPAPPDSVEQRLQSEKADETIFHPAVPLGLCTSAAVARHIVAIIGTQDGDDFKPEAILAQTDSREAVLRLLAASSSSDIQSPSLAIVSAAASLPLLNVMADAIWASIKRLWLVQLERHMRIKPAENPVAEVFAVVVLDALLEQGLGVYLLKEHNASSRDRASGSSSSSHAELALKAVQFVSAEVEMMEAVLTDATERTRRLRAGEEGGQQGRVQGQGVAHKPHEDGQRKGELPAVEDAASLASTVPLLLPTPSPAPAPVAMDAVASSLESPPVSAPALQAPMPKHVLECVIEVFEHEEKVAADKVAAAERAAREAAAAFLPGAGSSSAVSAPTVSAPTASAVSEPTASAPPAPARTTSAHTTSARTVSVAIASAPTASAPTDSPATSTAPPSPGISHLATQAASVAAARQSSSCIDEGGESGPASQARPSSASKGIPLRSQVGWLATSPHPIAALGPRPACRAHPHPNHPASTATLAGSQVAAEWQQKQQNESPRATSSTSNLMAPQALASYACNSARRLFSSASSSASTDRSPYRTPLGVSPVKPSMMLRGSPTFFVGKAPPMATGASPAGPPAPYDKRGTSTGASTDRSPEQTLSFRGKAAPLAIGYSPAGPPRRFELRSGGAHAVRI